MVCWSPGVVSRLSWVGSATTEGVRRSGVRAVREEAMSLRGPVAGGGVASSLRLSIQMVPLPPVEAVTTISIAPSWSWIFSLPAGPHAKEKWRRLSRMVWEVVGKLMLRRLTHQTFS